MPGRDWQDRIGKAVQAAKEEEIVAFIEAFMRGHWRSDDLTSLIRLFIFNREVLETMEGGAAIASVDGRAAGDRGGRGDQG